MSLYGFGKVVAEELPALTEALSCCASRSVFVNVGELDEEDGEAIAKMFGVARRGVSFSISSHADGDATALWSDAMEVMRKQVTLGDFHPDALADFDPRQLSDEDVRVFSKTDLGRVGACVLALGDTAALALVDGGIEDVFEADLGGCLRRMAADVLQLWDQAPNRLYVRR